MYDVSGEDEDPSGGSPAHGGRGGGGPVDEGGDGGETGVEQPGAGIGEDAGSSDRKGGQLCQGVVCIWISGGSLLSPCQYLITAQL